MQTIQAEGRLCIAQYIIEGYYIIEAQNKITIIHKLMTFALLLSASSLTLAPGGRLALW